MKSNPMQAKYQEYGEGYTKALRESGWEEKRKQPITPDLLQEFKQFMLDLY